MMLAARGGVSVKNQIVLLLGPTRGLFVVLVSQPPCKVTSVGVGRKPLFIVLLHVLLHGSAFCCYRQAACSTDKPALLPAITAAANQCIHAHVCNTLNAI